MSRNPHHDRTNGDISQKNLLLATLLNFIISFAEIIGGILSNSLALISDAIHNLSDAFAVLIAYISHRVGKKRPDLRRTFGFRRIEILAALFNALVLIGITVYLFYESYHRFLNPEPVRGRIMFIVAAIGFAANLLAVFLLRKDAFKNINVRAAYIHLVGDTLSSVAVIVGSIIIYLWDVSWIDPLITILIGVYILKHAYRILKETVGILMQASPADIDLMKIKKDIELIPDVVNIHHAHIWNLTDQQVHFECHIDLDKDILLSQVGIIRKQIERILLDRYRISHITIQFEYNVCDDKDLIHNRDH